MAEETQEVKAEVKKKSGWFSKIPADILMSPGGIILIFVAATIEIIDLIPIPVLDQIIELPLELFFMAMLVFIAKVPIKGLVIPFIIERIPLINDVLPTWLIRIFM